MVCMNLALNNFFVIVSYFVFEMYHCAPGGCVEQVAVSGRVTRRDATNTSGKKNPFKLREIASF